MQVPPGFLQPVQEQANFCLHFSNLLEAWQRAQRSVISRLTKQHWFPMLLQQVEQIHFCSPPNFCPWKAVLLP